MGQVDVELPGGARFWHDVVRLHRAEWVPAHVGARPDCRREIWNAGSLVAMMRFLMAGI
jgi:hypothetical protein